MPYTKNELEYIKQKRDALLIAPKILINSFLDAQNLGDIVTYTFPANFERMHSEKATEVASRISEYYKNIELRSMRANADYTNKGNQTNFSMVTTDGRVYIGFNDYNDTWVTKGIDRTMLDDNDEDFPNPKVYEGYYTMEEDYLYHFLMGGMKRMNLHENWYDDLAMLELTMRQIKRNTFQN